MNRWARIVWAIALVASVGWLGAGALGFKVHDQASLIIHTLVSFVALLALLLAHAWMAVFAVVSKRLVTRAAARDSRALASASRTILAAVAIALVAALALFTVSNALFPARLKPKSHAQAAAASVAALAVALTLEARALREHARAVAAISAITTSSPSEESLQSA